MDSRTDSSTKNGTDGAAAEEAASDMVGMRFMNALENICQIYMIQAGFGVAEVVGTLELLKKKIMDRTFLRRLAKIRKKQEEEWAKKRVEAEAEEKLKIVTPDGFDIRDKD